MMIDVRCKLRSEIESNRSEIVSRSTKKEHYCVENENEFSYEKRAANHVYIHNGVLQLSHMYCEHKECSEATHVGFLCSSSMPRLCL